MEIKKLRDLILQNESEILEFKQNNEDPERIGKCSFFWKNYNE